MDTQSVLVTCNSYVLQSHREHWTIAPGRSVGLAPCEALITDVFVSLSIHNLVLCLLQFQDTLLKEWEYLPFFVVELLDNSIITHA